MFIFLGIRGEMGLGVNSLLVLALLVGVPPNMHAKCGAIPPNMHVKCGAIPPKT